MAAIFEILDGGAGRGKKPVKKRSNTQGFQKQLKMGLTFSK